MKLCLVRSFGHNKEPRRTCVRRIGVWISLGLVPVFMAGVVFGQEHASGQLPKVRKVSRAPLSHIYMHFLLYQSHLDKAAEAHEQKGKDGSWLRDHYQKKLGFTPSEFAIVCSAGLRLESDLKENRTQVMAIVLADRAARLKDPNQWNAPRIPPPQLKDLTEQREVLIEREVEHLNHESSTS